MLSALVTFGYSLVECTLGVSTVDSLLPPARLMEWYERTRRKGVPSGGRGVALVGGSCVDSGEGSLLQC